MAARIIIQQIWSFSPEFTNT